MTDRGVREAGSYVGPSGLRQGWKRERSECDLFKSHHFSAYLLGIKTLRKHRKRSPGGKLKVQVEAENTERRGMMELLPENFRSATIPRQPNGSLGMVVRERDDGTLCVCE